jgi:hypothetical protein
MTGIQIGDDRFVVDARVIAEAFGIAAAEVQQAMRSGAITSRSEQGVGDDAGRWRLTFFHRGRALRLTVDVAGNVVTRARFDAPRR